MVISHLLTAVDAVQPLLQLSKGVTLQAFGPFLRNCGQRLPKKRLWRLRGGLGGGLRGPPRQTISLRTALLTKEAQKSEGLLAGLMLTIGTDRDPTSH